MAIEGQIPNGLMDTGVNAQILQPGSPPHGDCGIHHPGQGVHNASTDILATKQPALTDAQNSACEVSGTCSVNFDIAVELTKLYFDLRLAG